MTAGGMLQLAEFLLQFARVDRATFHPDGERPETDADHTVMVAVIACEVARAHPELGLDLWLVAQMGLVHDLVEGYAGDTQSMGITPEARASKEQRERDAAERIYVEFAESGPLMCESLRTYERQEIDEAKFVRYLDKLMPKLTHALNGGAAFKRLGKTPGEVRALHDRQIEDLNKKYPQFSGVLHPLLVEVCKLSEDAYRG